MKIESDMAVNLVTLAPSAGTLQSKRITRALAKSAKALSKSNQNEARIDAETARIDAETAQIDNNIPKTQIKLAYIYDTECIFDKYYDGNVLSAVITESGKSIPCVATVESNYIRVTFEALEEVATVTVTTL